MPPAPGSGRPPGDVPALVVHRDAPPVGTGVGAGVGVGVPSSIRILGRIRPSHFGSHQLAGPSNSMVAGTRTSRTSVASTNTATASPRPNILTVGSGSPRKLRKTLIMISAADVITRAVLARPSTTLRRLSWLS